MSDDASYTSFLDKANTDPKAGQGHEQSTSTSQSRSKFDPTQTSSSSSSSGISPEALPASLKSLPDVTYTSDTDAPFEPVVFSYSGSDLPSSAEFEKCLGSGKGQACGSVEELSVHEFDPRGEYKAIIERVGSAGKKDAVKVFRVEVGKTRVQYYVLTVGEGMLVGVVAKAVES